MTLKQMQYFVILVEKQSFTKAARECMTTQPNLSIQIQSLEQELQVCLLIRKGRSFELTPAGKLLYKRLIPILQSINTLPQQINHVGNNAGSTLRLGLPSSMAHHKLDAKLTEMVLCQTGLELSLSYGSHDELYERFGSGNLHAFISDESRLTQRDSFYKLPVSPSKMCVEFPCTLAVNNKGVKKLKVESSQLESLVLGYVCHPDFINDEQRFLEELLHVPVRLYAIDSLSSGRKALLGSNPPFNALLFTRSLLRGDYEHHDYLVPHDIIYHGETIKRPFSCYAKLKMHPMDLEELCQIVYELGLKHDKQSSFNEEEESPPTLLRSLPQSTKVSFTAERLAL